MSDKNVHPGSRDTARATRSSAAAGRPGLPHKVTRLDDPALQARLSALQKSLTEPAKAREFLREVGIITQSGKLSRRYGGR